MRAIDMSPPMLVEIDESAPLTDAARMMREKGVGDILITRVIGSESRLVGVITDRDIVVHAIACDLNPEELTVADLCTREPVMVDADADLTEITAAMNKHGVRRVLVTRESEIAGIVSLDNVIDAMAEMINNLSEMLTRQIDFEQTHLVRTRAQDSAA
jgi:CBS domain-containing protein